MYCAEEKKFLKWLNAKQSHADILMCGLFLMFGAELRMRGNRKCKFSLRNEN